MASSCTLYAKIANPAKAPANFLEIIQGEQKTITFVVDADGVFNNVHASSVSVTLSDIDGNTVVASTGSSSIAQSYESTDLQVIRATFSTTQTASLTPGIVKCEIAFDVQKAHLDSAIKIVKGL